MTQVLENEYPAIGLYGRQVRMLTIPAFDTPIGENVLPNSHFVCLLCSDARGVSDRTIIDTATHLLGHGLVYLCTWGPNSTRIRHLFEAAALVWNSHVAVLTVDLHESLDDALDYFLDVASPAIDYAPTCQAGLILNVGMTNWAKHIHQRLDTVALGF